MLSQDQREKRWKQKGTILWFTGLSGSGKTTLSTKLEETLFSKGLLVYRLDGDIIRQGLNIDLGFTLKDRAENIRRVGEVAKLFSDAGFIICVAFISPIKKDREKARNTVPPGRFIEIHLDCPIEICEKRDSRGLYSKARRGIIKNFTGISSPYDPPESPEIYLQTDKNSSSECINKIMKYLTEHDYIL